MTELPPNIKERLLAEIDSARSLTRPQGIARRLAWAGIGLVMVAGGALMNGLPIATASRPMSYLLVCSGLTLVTAILASAWILSSGRSSLGRSSRSLRGLAVAVPVALALGVLAGNLAAPGTWQAPHREWVAHLMCLALYFELGAALLLVSLFGVRPLDPIAPSTTGAALGAAVGACTTFAVATQCPLADPTHALPTHIAPAILLVGVGLVAGPRVLGFRYRVRR